MPVLLRNSDDLPEPLEYETWFAVTGARGRGPEDKKYPDLARRLENTFDDVRPRWWKLARSVADSPGAELSVAATCAGYGSDFGLMLAWCRLVETAQAGNDRVLVVCDDPWLFRELAEISGVAAGDAPALWPKVAALRLRGFLARSWLALRLAWASLATRNQRRAHEKGDRVILVYAHPRSDADGFDDYFGPMMREIPTLKRLLHTDAVVAQARALGADGRTASLHAWGSPWRALSLLAVRWRPRTEHFTARYGWLVRRAADIEGSGGTHASNAWQRSCQKTWLKDVAPAVVAWPWENLGWERAFSRDARRIGVATLGYQHTVIGSQQLNQSPAANADGEASLPDRVFCDGAAYRDELIAWGFPKDRLAIAGSLRLHVRESDLYDPNGPVFMALSGILVIARQQMAAARRIAASGRRVLIKEHPMYPMRIDNDGAIARTDRPLAEQSGLSAVVYGTGTSGLDALLAGLPAIRLLAEDQIAISVLPKEIAIPAATADEIVDAVGRAERLEIRNWTQILAPVDMALWRSALAATARTHG